MRRGCSIMVGVSRAARLLLAAAALGCERVPRGPVDSAARDTTPSARPDLPADWPTELGTALLVPADSEQTATLLYPADAAARVPAGVRFLLLSPGGDSMAAQGALVSSDSQVCGEAPTLRLSDSVPRAWAVGLRAPMARVLPMDSIEAMTASDSSRLVAELARIASTLPGSSEARFVGLPFVVSSARRFNSPDRHYLAAHLMRRLPQEATPLEERVFFIAERDAATTSGPYTTTYHLRSAGTEETADHYDVLAALSGDSAVYVLLARDRDARTSYELLERSKAGSWRVRWVRILAC